MGESFIAYPWFLLVFTAVDKLCVANKLSTEYFCFLTKHSAV